MTRRGGQLALQFPLSEKAVFETFVTAGNAELVGRLQWLSDPGGARTAPAFAGCLIHGPAGTGRSHLLQAACHRYGGHGGGAICLPLADPRLTPELLEGLETLGLVALDDVDAWLGRAEAERALLALYQGLSSGGGRLLVSARAPAVGLEFHYPDLGSRLRGLPAYRLAALSDEDKARVLIGRARQRGLELAPPVLDFWLARSSRDLAQLLVQLDRLDQAAMAAQRRVTVPLVKEVLGL